MLGPEFAEHGSSATGYYQSEDNPMVGSSKLSPADLAHTEELHLASLFSDMDLDNVENSDHALPENVAAKTESVFNGYQDMALALQEISDASQHSKSKDRVVGAFDRSTYDGAFKEMHYPFEIDHSDSSITGSDALLHNLVPFTVHPSVDHGHPVSTYVAKQAGPHPGSQVPDHPGARGLEAKKDALKLNKCAANMTIKSRILSSDTRVQKYTKPKPRKGKARNLVPWQSFGPEERDALLAMHAPDHGSRVSSTTVFSTPRSIVFGTGAMTPEEKEYRKQQAKRRLAQGKKALEKNIEQMMLEQTILLEEAKGNMNRRQAMESPGAVAVQ